MPDWRYNVLSTSDAYLCAGAEGPTFDPLAASYPRRADRSRPVHTCPYTTIFLGNRTHRNFQQPVHQTDYGDNYSLDRSSNLTDTSSFARYEECRPDGDENKGFPTEEDSLQVKNVPYTSNVFYIAAKTELPPDVVHDNDLFLADRSDSDALSSCTCDSFERCEFDCRDFEPFSDTCCCDPLSDGVCTRSPKHVESPEQCDEVVEDDEVSTRSDMDGLDLALFEPAQSDALEDEEEPREQVPGPTVSTSLCGILFALPETINAEGTPTAVNGALVGVASTWAPFYCVLQQDRRTLTAYTSEELAVSNNNGEYSTQSLPRVRIDGGSVHPGVRLRCWAAPPSITEEEAEDEVDDDAVSLRAVPVQGIYAGHGKPSDLDAFFGPFVAEMIQLQDGLTVTTKSQKEIKVQVKIRAFICDSPARAMIKGVSNFNSKNGCLKCTVVGEYSHRSNTVSFHRIDCPKRNDDDFRAKKYGQHHKLDSPLLKLNIDMIEDFPVSDSLHLIDLGLMKRLLTGWRDGNFGLYLTKWSARDSEKVNNFLINAKMPTEIHRSVRSLEVLKFWKGSEYRTFLYYLSFIILKEVLRDAPYLHFMHLYCAITICSSEKHLKLLGIAKEMLAYFVEQFQNIYGKDYVTSNIHNLSHLVDEVNKFGVLQSYNAYEFENKLQFLKRMVRHGYKALCQVARRINEKDSIEIKSLAVKNKKYPVMKKQKRGYNVLHLDMFILSRKPKDRWFLTTDNNVVELLSVHANKSQTQEQDIEICGNIVERTQDAFTQPLKSSFLNIYECNLNEINSNRKENIFKISNIKCKLVTVFYGTKIYFIPLLHTL